MGLQSLIIGVIGCLIGRALGEGLYNLYEAIKRRPAEQKKRLIAEFNRNFEEDQEFLEIRPDREEIRRMAKADLINAAITGENAKPVAAVLRSHARQIMCATADQLVAVENTVSRNIGENMAIISMESLAGYLLGMANLISHNGSGVDKADS